MRKFRTPNGKTVTAEQYVNLVNRNEKPCEHGHLDCAAWNHSPCMDEVPSEMEAELLDQDDTHLDDAEWSLGVE